MSHSMRPPFLAVTSCGCPAPRRCSRDESTLARSFLSAGPNLLINFGQCEIDNTGDRIGMDGSPHYLRSLPYLFSRWSA